MGAKRFQILVAVSLVLFVHSNMSYAMDIRGSFISSTEIHQWSKKSFFGGYEIYTLSRSKHEVLIIIGMPTSGFATSQVAVYLKIPQGYRLVAFRNTVPGIAKVSEDEKQISLNIGTTTILALSWDSIENGAD